MLERHRRFYNSDIKKFSTFTFNLQFKRQSFYHGCLEKMEFFIQTQLKILEMENLLEGMKILYNRIHEAVRLGIPAEYPEYKIIIDYDYLEVIFM